jgi:hypothetical protein
VRKIVMGSIYHESDRPTLRSEAIEITPAMIEAAVMAYYALDPDWGEPNVEVVARELFEAMLSARS